MDANEELPELETAALEDLDLPMAPVDAPPPPPAAAPPPPPMQQQALSNPFDDPLPSAPPAAKSESLSLGDLGGDDFDLPMPPAGAQTTSTGPGPRPIASSPPAQAKPLAAPSFGGFKPATPAFASGGVPKPFGSAPTPAQPIAAVRPLAAAPVAAAQPMVDPKSLFGDAGDLGTTDATALRAMLTDETPPAHVPPEAGRLAFQLCRVLIKKGIITPDDLL